jgi:hypothetical protein
MSAEDGINNIVDGVTQEGGASGAVKGGLTGAIAGGTLGGAFGFALGGPIGGAAAALVGAVWQGLLCAERGSKPLKDRDRD